MEIKIEILRGALESEPCMCSKVQKRGRLQASKQAGRQAQKQTNNATRL